MRSKTPVKARSRIHDMTDNNATNTQANETEGVALDPQFFTATNAYLELANQQGQTFGMKRVSAAILYAAARYNSHAFIGYETNPAANKEAFVEYMLDLYRRMLEENVDNLIENNQAVANAGQA